MRFLTVCMLAVGGLLFCSVHAQFNPLKNLKQKAEQVIDSDTTESRNINIEIISNSPPISSINALLSLPLIGNSGDNKVIKVAGYKALLSKTSGDNDDVN